MIGMKKLYILLATLALVNCSQKKDMQPIAQAHLPSALIDGRFYLKIPTVKGDTILGFCDTGGGYTAIYNSTIKNLQLESAVKEAEIGKYKIKHIYAKDLYDNSVIPYPHIGSFF